MDTYIYCGKEGEEEWHEECEEQNNVRREDEEE